MATLPAFGNAAEFITYKKHEMTQFFTTILIIGIAISLSLIVIIIRHIRLERKAKKLRVYFYNVAAEFNFFISKQEVLGSRWIALDVASNRLLFLEGSGDKREGYLIDLDEVKTSAVKREYALLKSNDKYRANMEPIVNRILLQLDYKSGRKPLALTFYDKASDSVYEMQERVAKINEWQSAITNLLTKDKAGMDIYKWKSSKRAS